MRLGGLAHVVAGEERHHLHVRLVVDQAREDRLDDGERIGRVQVRLPDVILRLEDAVIGVVALLVVLDAVRVLHLGALEVAPEISQHLVLQLRVGLRSALVSEGGQLASPSLARAASGVGTLRRIRQFREGGRLLVLRLGAGSGLADQLSAVRVIPQRGDCRMLRSQARRKAGRHS